MKAMLEYKLQLFLNSEGGSRLQLLRETNELVFYITGSENPLDTESVRNMLTLSIQQDINREINR